MATGRLLGYAIAELDVDGKVELDFIGPLYATAAEARLAQEEDEEAAAREGDGVREGIVVSVWEHKGD